MGGSDNVSYRTNQIIASFPESDNVVHRITTFIPYLVAKLVAMEPFLMLYFCHYISP